MPEAQKPYGGGETTNMSDERRKIIVDAYRMWLRGLIDENDLMQILKKLELLE